MNVTDYEDQGLCALTDMHLEDPRSPLVGAPTPSKGVDYCPSCGLYPMPWTHAAWREVEAQLPVGV